MMDAKVMIGDEAFTQRSGDREFSLIIEEAQDHLRCELRKRKKQLRENCSWPACPFTTTAASECGHTSRIIKCGYFQQLAHIILSRCAYPDHASSALVPPARTLPTAQPLRPPSTPPLRLNKLDWVHSHRTRYEKNHPGDEQV